MRQPTQWDTEGLVEQEYARCFRGWFDGETWADAELDDARPFSTDTDPMPTFPA